MFIFCDQTNFPLFGLIQKACKRSREI